MPIVKLTKSKCVEETFFLHDAADTRYYSLVKRVGNQNQLRKMLSILYRTKYSGRFPVCTNYDLYITFENKVENKDENKDENKEYCIWAYTVNFKGNADFLGGILVTPSQRFSRSQRHRRRRKKKSLLTPPREKSPTQENNNG